MTLRIINSDDFEKKNMALADAAHAAVNAAISDGAVAFLVIYENSETVKYQPVPNINCVAGGLIMRAQDVMFGLE
jgi:hypothetical protein